MNVRQPIQTAQVLGPAAAAFLVHLVLLALYLTVFQGHWSALICVGQERIGRPPFDQVAIGFPKTGYDGQYYYAIAQAPFARHELAHIEAPSRHLRILYPLLAWLLTGGDANLLFWALPFINLAAIAMMAGVAALLAARSGLSPWWGFWLPVVVNAGLPVFRDLTDNVSTLALCFLLTGWLLRWEVGRLTLAGAAAVFAREQNVLILLLILSAALVTSRREIAASLGIVVALWAAWVVILRISYGEWPLISGFMGLPFAGMAELMQTTTAYRWLHVLALIHLALLIGLAGYLMRSEGDAVIKGMAFVGAILATSAGFVIYASPWSYARVFTWLPLGLWFLSMQTRQVWMVWLLALGGFWPLVALTQAWRGFA